MKAPIFSPLLFILIFSLGCHNRENAFQKISLETYIDKMTGAWVGQMAGVGWGQPTEFRWVDTYIPADKVPAWERSMINQHGNDDIYVEMTFLATLEKYGTEVSIRQAGIDFANSGYSLWAANNAGRENLRNGIAPPESSHPALNSHCDDIDYQIEADYSGILAPGMPDIAIALGEKFGRLMNYGDGMYGGQFMGGMYAAAFFEKDIEKIIGAGLSCIPAQSLYAGCIRDVITWFHENPADWTITWQLIEDKYRKSPEFQHFAQQNKSVYIPIDCKLNGAYVAMGLLYGKGNMDSTIVIAMRGGKDSDCNPSNAAGVLGTVIGYQGLSDKFKDSLDTKKNFQFSEYNLDELKIICEKLARQYIQQHGGIIQKDNDGMEYFLIPETVPVPSLFKPSYDPGPVDRQNLYSKEELSRINAYSSHRFDSLFKIMNLDMTVTHCGKNVIPGIGSWNGKNNVITTCPMSSGSSVNLMYHLNRTLQPGKKYFICFTAGHDKNSAWKIVIRKDWKNLLDEEVSGKNSHKGWIDYRIDVSDWAGSDGGDLEFSAMNIDGAIAKNYWTGFTLISSNR